MKSVRRALEFEWDNGNKDKNLVSHRVSDKESEEIFLDKNKKIFKDALHSGKEPRYIVIGKTKEERLLFAAFTIRKSKLRVISARDLNRKERHLYEKKT